MTYGGVSKNISPYILFYSTTTITSLRLLIQPFKGSEVVIASAAVVEFVGYFFVVSIYWAFLRGKSLSIRSPRMCTLHT